MSEPEINKDNCVLSEDELSQLEDMQGGYYAHLLDEVDFSSKEIKKTMKSLDLIFQKITKLNDLGKHEMLMEDSRKNDTDIAILLG